MPILKEAAGDQLMLRFLIIAALEALGAEVVDPGIWVGHDGSVVKAHGIHECRFMVASDALAQGF